MDPVTTLIFNALAGRARVYLPQAGLLYVVTNPAVRNPDGSILPPNNDVALSESGDGIDGVSIVDMIMSSGRKDREAAENIYNRWLAEKNDNGVIRIESVGTISDGRFIMDKSLRSALNPAGTKTIHRERGRSAVLMAVAVIIAVAAGAAISISAITYLDRSNRHESQATEMTASAPRFAETTEKPGENVPGVSPTAEDSMSPPLSPTVASASVSGPGYYVVIGVYSTDNNADRFIAESSLKDNALQYNKLPLKNGKIVVYTSRWATQEEANANRRLTNFPEAWIFKYGE